MSDEISDERAEEMAARFERMEPAGTPEITPLGELYLAVQEIKRLRALIAAFHEADGTPQ